MLMNIHTLNQTTVMPCVTEELRWLSKCLEYLPQRHKHLLNSCVGFVWHHITIKYLVGFYPGPFYLSSSGLDSIKAHLYFRVLFMQSTVRLVSVFKKGTARLAGLGPRQSTVLAVLGFSNGAWLAPVS